MDKTFAETKGFAPFDWNLFFDRLERGELKRGEKQRAKGLAAQWTTCACGNQCAILPRWDDGSPKDSHLWSLGLWFMNATKAGKWDDARGYLRRIEECSAGLIAETLAKLTAAATPARTGPDGKGEGQP